MVDVPIVVCVIEHVEGALRTLKSSYDDLGVHAHGASERWLRSTHSLVQYLSMTRESDRCTWLPPRFPTCLKLG